MECNICLEKNKCLKKCYLCNYYLCNNCLYIYLIKYGHKKCPHCRKDGLNMYIKNYKMTEYKFKCIQLILIVALYFLTLYLKGYLIFYIFSFFIINKISIFSYIFVGFVSEVILCLIVIMLGLLFPVTTIKLLNIITR